MFVEFTKDELEYIQNCIILARTRDDEIRFSFQVILAGKDGLAETIAKKIRDITAWLSHKKLFFLFTIPGEIPALI